MAVVCGMYYNRRVQDARGKHCRSGKTCRERALLDGLKICVGVNAAQTLTNCLL